MSPPAETFAEAEQLGLDTRPVLDREPFSGAAHALLDLVVVEDPAVLLAQVVQGPRPLGRRDLHAVLALDELDVDTGDAVGRGLVLEDHLLDVVEAGEVTGRVLEVVRAAVAGGEGHVDPAAHERLDGVVVVGVVRAHGAGAVVAAVEAAEEGDDEGAARAGGLAHDAHRVLDDLAAGGVVDDLGERRRGDVVELLREQPLVFDAQRRETFGTVVLETLVRGRDQFGVVAAQGGAGPAVDPVEVAVAVDVLDEPAVAVAGDEVARRPAADERHSQKDVVAALHQGGTARAGGRGVDLGAGLVAHALISSGRAGRLRRRAPATGVDAGMLAQGGGREKER